jgi:glycerol-3-phosphate dehydrogenase
VDVTDLESGDSLTLNAGAVINATGAWANRLGGAGQRIRPLRGSHLFVDPARLPVADCLTLINPRDGRPVFVFPWEGVTCVGTTDLDHGDSLDQEARASGAEVDYLLELINGQFPEVKLSRDDILSTMAGVRPVISAGEGKDPSKERRHRHGQRRQAHHLPVDRPGRALRGRPAGASGRAPRPAQ